MPCGDTIGNSLTTAAIFDANRAHGHIGLSVVARDGSTHRQQRGSKTGRYRVRFPDTDGDGSEAVIVNTAGGVAGGDDFSVSIAAEAGTRLSVTTAAAEKVYRAIAAPARMQRDAVG